MKAPLTLKQWLIYVPVLIGMLAGYATFSYVKDRRLQKGCQEIRAGFDIGSSSTKITVAEVNICKSKVMRILLDESKRIPYQESLQQNGGTFISPDVIKSGIALLKDYKARSMALGVKRFSGYASSAFRKSSNGRDIVEEINHSTGINIRIISQEEEAQIGFRSVQAMLEVPIPNLVVWDIGGGSQQIMMAESDHIAIFKGAVASVGFRDKVIHEVKNEDPIKITTPNPMTSEQIAAAVQLARTLAPNIARTFIERFAQPKTVVIGIGGVHWSSIKLQTGNKETYALADLETAMAQRADQPDSFFETEFADTELTNLALVYGLMKEVGIKEVRPMKVNLALGAIVDPVAQ